MSDKYVKLEEVFEILERKANKLNGARRRKILLRVKNYKSEYGEYLKHQHNLICDLDNSEIDIVRELIPIERDLVKRIANAFGMEHETNWLERKKSLMRNIRDARVDTMKKMTADDELPYMETHAHNMETILHDHLDKHKGLDGIDDLVDKFIDEEIRFTTEWNQLFDRKRKVPKKDSEEDRNRLIGYLRDFSQQLGEFNQTEAEFEREHKMDTFADYANEMGIKIVNDNPDKPVPELVDDLIIEKARYVTEFNARFNMDLDVPDLDNAEDRKFMESIINSIRA